MWSKAFGTNSEPSRSSDSSRRKKSSSSKKDKKASSEVGRPAGRTGDQSDPDTPTRRSRRAGRTGSDHDDEHLERRSPRPDAQSERGSSSTSSRIPDSRKQNTRGISPPDAGTSTRSPLMQNANLASTVPNQFPNQAPQDFSLPYRPPTFDNPHGEAADYYGDQGDSIHEQPGVRPGTPIVVGNEPHLMPALSVAAPPEETGNGSAADFYSAHPDASGPPSSVSALAGPQMTGSSQRPVGPQQVPNQPLVSKPLPSTSTSVAAASGIVVGEAAEYYSASADFSQTANHGSTTGQPPAGSLPQGAPGRPSQPPSQHSSSGVPLAAIGVAGGAAAAAYAYHHQHHQGSQPSSQSAPGSGGRPPSYSRPDGRPDVPYDAGTSQSYHEQHRDRGPLGKFVDWWNDYDDVRRMEEYTEYIGVCKYCFDPDSTIGDAPRKHRPRRKRSQEFKHRVDKESRYGRQSSSSSSSDSDGFSKSFLGAGLVGLGLASASSKKWKSRKGSDEPRTGTDVIGTPLPTSNERRRKVRDDVLVETVSSGGRRKSRVTFDDYNAEALTQRRRRSPPGYTGKAGNTAAAEVLASGTAVYAVRESSKRQSQSEGVTVNADSRRRRRKQRRSSSSSSASDAGIWNALFSPQPKKDKEEPTRRPSSKTSGRRRRSSSPMTATKAVAGLSTAAALLAAAESRSDRSGHEGSSVFAARERRRPFARVLRPSRSRDKPSDDAWEDASEDGSMSGDTDISADSALAFGAPSEPSSSSSGSETDSESGLASDQPVRTRKRRREPMPQPRPDRQRLHVLDPVPLNESPSPRPTRDTTPPVAQSPFTDLPLQQPQPVKPTSPERMQAYVEAEPITSKNQRDSAQASDPALATNDRRWGEAEQRSLEELHDDHADEIVVAGGAAAVALAAFTSKYKALERQSPDEDNRKSAEHVRELEEDSEPSLAAAEINSSREIGEPSGSDHIDLAQPDVQPEFREVRPVYKPIIDGDDEDETDDTDDFDPDFFKRQRVGPHSIDPSITTRDVVEADHLGEEAEKTPKTAFFHPVPPHQRAIAATAGNVPTINLIEPTPPASYAGSYAGSTADPQSRPSSPLRQGITIDDTIQEVDTPTETPTIKRRVMWSDEQTIEEHVETTTPGAFPDNQELEGANGSSERSVADHPHSSASDQLFDNEDSGRTTQVQALDPVEEGDTRENPADLGQKTSSDELAPLSMSRSIDSLADLEHRDVDTRAPAGNSDDEDIPDSYSDLPYYKRLPDSRPDSPYETPIEEAASATPQTPGHSRSATADGKGSRTAIPLRFRGPLPSPRGDADSQTATSPSIMSPEPLSPSVRRLSRMGRQGSADFKTSHEYRPLYLPSKYTAHQEPDPVEMLPALPPSRSSSVVDDDDSRSAVASQASSSPAFRPTDSVLSDWSDPGPAIEQSEYLDSEEVTPKALPVFSDLQEVDQFDLGPSVLKHKRSDTSVKTQDAGDAPTGRSTLLLESMTAGAAMTVGAVSALAGASLVAAKHVGSDEHSGEPPQSEPKDATAEQEAVKEVVYADHVQAAATIEQETSDEVLLAQFRTMVRARNQSRADNISYDKKGKKQVRPDPLGSIVTQDTKDGFDVPQAAEQPLRPATPQSKAAAEDEVNPPLTAIHAIRGSGDNVRAPFPQPKDRAHRSREDRLLTDMLANDLETKAGPAETSQDSPLKAQAEGTDEQARAPEIPPLTAADDTTEEMQHNDQVKEATKSQKPPPPPPVHAIRGSADNMRELFPQPKDETQRSMEDKLLTDMLMNDLVTAAEREEATRTTHHDHPINVASRHLHGELSAQHDDLVDTVPSILANLGPLETVASQDSVAEVSTADPAETVMAMTSRESVAEHLVTETAARDATSAIDGEFDDSGDAQDVPSDQMLEAEDTAAIEALFNRTPKDARASLRAVEDHEQESRSEHDEREHDERGEALGFESQDQAALPGFLSWLTGNGKSSKGDEATQMKHEEATAQDEAKDDALTASMPGAMPAVEREVQEIAASPPQTLPEVPDEPETTQPPTQQERELDTPAATIDNDPQITEANAEEEFPTTINMKKGKKGKKAQKNDREASQTTVPKVIVPAVVPKDASPAPTPGKKKKGKKGKFVKFVEQPEEPTEPAEAGDDGLLDDILGDTARPADSETTAARTVDAQPVTADDIEEAQTEAISAPADFLDAEHEEPAGLRYVSDEQLPDAKGHSAKATEEFEDRFPTIQDIVKSDAQDLTATTLPVESSLADQKSVVEEATPVTVTPVVVSQPMEASESFEERFPTVEDIAKSDAQDLTMTLMPDDSKAADESIIEEAVPVTVKPMEIAKPLSKADLRKKAKQDKKRQKKKGKQAFTDGDKSEDEAEPTETEDSKSQNVPLVAEDEVAITREPSGYSQATANTTAFDLLAEEEPIVPELVVATSMDREPIPDEQPELAVKHTSKTFVAPAILSPSLEHTVAVDFALVLAAVSIAPKEPVAVMSPVQIEGTATSDEPTSAQHIATTDTLDSIHESTSVHSAVREEQATSKEPPMFAEPMSDEDLPSAMDAATMDTLASIEESTSIFQAARQGKETTEEPPLHQEPADAEKTVKADASLPVGAAQIPGQWVEETRETQSEHRPQAAVVQDTTHDMDLGPVRQASYDSEDGDYKARQQHKDIQSTITEEALDIQEARAELITPLEQQVEDSDGDAAPAARDFATEKSGKIRPLTKKEKKKQVKKDKQRGKNTQEDKKLQEKANTPGTLEEGGARRVSFALDPVTAEFANETIDTAEPEETNAAMEWNLTVATGKKSKKETKKQKQKREFEEAKAALQGTSLPSDEKIDKVKPHQRPIPSLESILHEDEPAADVADEPTPGDPEAHDAEAQAIVERPAVAERYRTEMAHESLEAPLEPVPMSTSRGFTNVAEIETGETPAVDLPPPLELRAEDDRSDYFGTATAGEHASGVSHHESPLNVASRELHPEMSALHRPTPSEERGSVLESQASRDEARNMTAEDEAAERDRAEYLDERCPERTEFGNFQHVTDGIQTTSPEAMPTSPTRRRRRTRSPTSSQSSRTSSRKLSGRSSPSQLWAANSHQDYDDGPELPTATIGRGDDVDFAATLAAGLEHTGFDPEMVIRDPRYHQLVPSPERVWTSAIRSTDVVLDQPVKVQKTPSMRRGFRNLDPEVGKAEDEQGVKFIATSPEEQHLVGTDESLPTNLQEADVEERGAVLRETSPQPEEEAPTSTRTGEESRSHGSTADVVVMTPLAAAATAAALNAENSRNQSPAKGGSKGSKKKGKKGKKFVPLDEAQEMENLNDAKAEDDIINEYDPEPVADHNKPPAPPSTWNPGTAEPRETIRDSGYHGSTPGTPEMSYAESHGRPSWGPALSAISDSPPSSHVRMEPSPVDSTTRDRSSGLFEDQAAPHSGAAYNPYERFHEQSPSFSHSEPAHNPYNEQDSQEQNFPLTTPALEELEEGYGFQDHSADTTRDAKPRQSSHLEPIEEDEVERLRDEEEEVGMIQEMPGPHGSREPGSLSLSPSNIANPRLRHRRTSSMGSDEHIRRPSSRLSSAAVSQRSVTPTLHRSRPSSDLGVEYRKGLAGSGQPSLLSAASSNNNTPSDQTSRRFSSYDPLKGTGKDRRQMSSDGDSYDERRNGQQDSARSASQSQSTRKRQRQRDSLGLEDRSENSVSESRSRSRQDQYQPSDELRARDETLREKDVEINSMRLRLEAYQRDAGQLAETNAQLLAAHQDYSSNAEERAAVLEAERDHAHSQWQTSSRELEELRSSAGVSAGVLGAGGLVAGGATITALTEKDAEIISLRAQLTLASQRIRSLQQQILTSSITKGTNNGSNSTDFLNQNQKDTEYFTSAFSQLLTHIQSWILRFSKFSDMRVCRSLSELNDEVIETRLDNTLLDGTDVDTYLADRVLRRDVFMSVTMALVWEYVFTRYLFGLEREQRQKLKALEKSLAEVGPPAAVSAWRATTLNLLSRRPQFAKQRVLDEEAVAAEILRTLSAVLPPPQNLMTQITESLKNVLRLAVDLSIDMRTQKEEYMMLPPLQPAYDTHGDLSSKVYFNAGLMNERSGLFTDNEELAREGRTVRVVLFPLVVVKRRDGWSEAGEEEEEVVSAAQVCISRDVSARLKGRGGLMPGVVWMKSNVSVGRVSPTPGNRIGGVGGMV